MCRREPGKHVGHRKAIGNRRSLCPHDCHGLFYVTTSHFNQLYGTRGLSPPFPRPGQVAGRRGPQDPNSGAGAEQQGRAPGPRDLGREWAQGRQLGAGARAGPVQSAKVAAQQEGTVPTGTTGDSWECTLCHVVPSAEHRVVRAAETFLPVGARGPGPGSSEPACRWASRTPGCAWPRGPDWPPSRVPVPPPQEGRNVSTPCLSGGGAGSQLLLGPPARAAAPPTHGLPGAVTCRDSPEPTPHRTGDAPPPKATSRSRLLPPSDVGTWRQAGLMLSPRAFAQHLARRHQCPAERVPVTAADLSGTHVGRRAFVCLRSEDSVRPTAWEQDCHLQRGELWGVPIALPPSWTPGSHCSPALPQGQPHGPLCWDAEGGCHSGLCQARTHSRGSPFLPEVTQAAGRRGFPLQSGADRSQAGPLAQAAPSGWLVLMPLACPCPGPGGR